MLARVTKRQVWNGGSATSPDDVAEAARRLAPRKNKPDEAPSFYEVRDGDLPSDVVAAFMLLQDKPSASEDYILISPAMLEAVGLEATPVPTSTLPPFLRDRHYEIRGLREEPMRLALATQVLMRPQDEDEPRSRRVKDKDVVAAAKRGLLDRIRYSPEDLSDDWRRLLEV